jgi:hypothetical protein
MTWTANLTGVSNEGANIVPTVVFTNDATGETITEYPRANDIDSARLRKWAAVRIAALEQRDASATTLITGPVAAPDAQAPWDAQREAFFVLYSALVRVKKAVDMGLIDQTSPVYAEKLQAVRAALKPSYLNDSRFG